MHGIEVLEKPEKPPTTHQHNNKASSQRIHVGHFQQGKLHQGSQATIKRVHIHIHCTIGNFPRT